MFVTYEFRWIRWNIEKCQRHGVNPSEAEDVVNHPSPPYPKQVDNRKTMVRGQTWEGRYLQVIYLLESGDVVFVIHARPLTEPEKRRLRRRRK